MTWFAASIVYAFYPRARDPDHLLIEENVLLIEAQDSDDGWKVAERLGKEGEYDDESLTLDDVPAVRKYVGVRKLISIQGPIDRASDEPSHGAEITYYSYTLDNVADLDALMHQDSVKIALHE